MLRNKLPGLDELIFSWHSHVHGTNGAQPDKALIDPLGKHYEFERRGRAPNTDVIVVFGAMLSASSLFIFAPMVISAAFSTSVLLHEKFFDVAIENMSKTAMASTFSLLMLILVCLSYGVAMPVIVDGEKLKEILMLSKGGRSDFRRKTHQTLAKYYKGKLGIAQVVSMIWAASLAVGALLEIRDSAWTYCDTSWHVLLSMPLFSLIAVPPAAGILLTVAAMIVAAKRIAKRRTVDRRARSLASLFAVWHWVKHHYSEIIGKQRYRLMVNRMLVRASTDLTRIHIDEVDGISIAPGAAQRLSDASDRLSGLAVWLTLPQQNTQDALLTELSRFISPLYYGTLHELPGPETNSGKGRTGEVVHAVDGRRGLLANSLRTGAAVVATGLYLAAPLVCLALCEHVMEVQISKIAGSLLPLLYGGWLAAGGVYFISRAAPEARDLVTQVVTSVLRK